MSREHNILNVYNLMQHPLRSSMSDHLYSFRRHGRGRHFYLNLAVRQVPGWMRGAPFDAVIYHTSFFAQRWAPELFRRQLEVARPLKGVGRVRVALPMDEFMQTDLLNGFVKEFEIDHVFTVAADSEVPKIYSEVDRERVGFTPVLTGYLSEDTTGRIEKILGEAPERPIDIGYRAWAGAPWLGRHGMLKGEIAEVVESAAAAKGLVTDISTDDADMLSGDDWFRFLASCKYTLGVEGGASLLDRDGSVRESTERYLEAHPGASFDEVAEACFPGQDGGLEYFAIGARHIEACATRTCQVLVEGDYQGVLRPGEHYLELKRDLSNLDEVLERIRDGGLRERTTEAAYRDVVASGRYTYERLVREVERVTLVQPPVADTRGAQAAMALRQARERLLDRISWVRVAYRLHLAPRLVRLSPRAALRAARRRRTAARS